MWGEERLAPRGRPLRAEPAERWWKVKSIRRSIGLLGLAAVAVLAPSAALAQTPAEIRVTPSELKLKIGQTATLTAKVVDADGNEVERNVIFFSTARRQLGVSSDGVVSASRAGEFTVTVIVPADPTETSSRAEPLLSLEVPVIVEVPAIASIEFVGVPANVYAGTRMAIGVRAIDELGAERPDPTLAYSSDNPSVAAVDEFGNLNLGGVGRARVSATVDGAMETLDLNVRENPTASIELTVDKDAANTGDVLRFTAVGRDARGREVADLPIHFATFGATAENIIAAGSTAEIRGDGRFVAERSGQYTVVATSGANSAMKTVKIDSRRVYRDIEVVGHGAVRDRHTSDLWIWEGADGDYAITGTWGAEGHANIWNVTDPANIHIIATFKVDARTVNDVKISEDGKLAILSREGASNRRNGIVVLDVSNPKLGVRKVSEFDDELTGGVHNVFVHQGHVYAVNNGRRYDIINIENPFEPFRVGRFELTNPGHSIHDVWVVNGIAYSSNWRDGVVAVDVGGGDMGGSPSNPIKMGQYAYPSGANHAAFPYRSKSTGKFYVFAGDESFPYGLHTEEGGAPTRAAGWIHVIEWDEWDKPREVARYQVPEAGTHNLWVEDDVMYIGYYNGGLRVVDVSGELMGDLYRQGREMGRFTTEDPKGYIANAPFVWGPQPFKGNIFVSDWNSGLWALKMGERTRAQPGLLEDRE